MRTSAMSTNRRANKEVLSNLCDKIESVSGLMNANVRNIFSLQEFVEYVDVPSASGEHTNGESQGSLIEPGLRLLPKRRLMKKLE